MGIKLTCGCDVDDVDDARQLSGIGTVCDDCYWEDWGYECCLCGEWQEDLARDDVDGTIMHRYVAVYDPAVMRSHVVERYCSGLYRVQSYPYYGDGILESWLWGDALGYVAPLPTGSGDETPDGYPVGHLCAACQKRLATSCA